MLTIVLTRADVARHCKALHLLREVREAYVARDAEADAPLRFTLPSLQGEVRHGALRTVPAFSVTVSAAKRGMLQLHDTATGKTLALMESSSLPALTASIASAVAVDALARSDAKTVAVLGSGLAASGALKALRLVRSLERVWTYEADLAANTELALRLQQSLNTSVRSVDTAMEAVEQADIVLLSGGVSLPTDTLKPGAHVTVLDAQHYAEPPLPAEALARARGFTDAPLPWAPFTTSLGALLRGAAPGRSSPEELTVFASSAPSFLDAVTAWHVYEGAKHDESLMRFDLEA